MPSQMVSAALCRHGLVLYKQLDAFRADSEAILMQFSQFTAK